MQKLYLPEKAVKKLRKQGLYRENPPGEFECKTCTVCCERYGLEINITLPDLYRMARQAKISMTEQFLKNIQIAPTNPKEVRRYKKLNRKSKPLSLQIEAPCKLLHPDYRQERENNCTIQRVKPVMCRLASNMCYDPGAGVDRIADYPCTHNRYISEKDLEKARAFEFLWRQELIFTLDALFDPMIEIPIKQIEQIEANMAREIKEENQQTLDELLKIRQNVRIVHFSDKGWRKKEDKEEYIANFETQVLGRRIVHGLYKHIIVKRLGSIEPETMEQIALFAQTYYDIRNGKIKSVPDTNEMRSSRVIVNRMETKKVGRNDPCPCDSGKKFKKCCGKH